MRKKKRLKIFEYLYFCFFSAGLFTINVRAYVDPSVMTYAIQAVAGIAIGLGAFFGIYFRKVKRKIQTKLNLDTRGNKQIESDALGYKDPASKKIFKIHIAEAVKSEKPLKAGYWKGVFNDIKSYAIPVFGFSFLLCVFAPLEMYFTNKNEFWYDFRTIFPWLLLMLLILSAVLLAVFAVCDILYHRFFQVVTVLFLIAYVVTWIQGTFLSKYLPDLSAGVPVFDERYIPFQKQSVHVLLFVTFLVIVFVRFFHMQGLQKTAKYGSGLLILVEIATIIIAGIRYDGFTSKVNFAVTDENQYTFSTNENLIIILLDGADSTTFQDQLNQYPEFQKDFADFTYFPNTVGAYPHTKYAVPFIFTGKWYENEGDFVDAETEFMDESPLFSELESSGWSTNVYETDLVYNNSNVFQFDNVKKKPFKINSFTDFAIKQMQLTGFKYAPYYLKPYINLNVDEFDSFRSYDEDARAFDDDNVSFYENLNSNGIQTREQNMFHFYHLRGPHPPFSTSADMNRLAEDSCTTYENAYTGSLRITAQFLNELKENGLYENSAIIIMADHGVTLDSDPMRQNPLLMVKGTGESHTFSISDAPISYDDLQECYHRLMEGKSSEDSFDAKEGDSRKRRYLYYPEWTRYYLMEEYYQTGYAADQNTLEKTGKTYRYRFY